MQFVIYLFSEAGCWIWTIFESIAIITTLVFVVLQLKQSHNSTLIDVVYRLEEKWSSSEMKEARIQVCKNYLDDTLSISRTEELIMGYFEDLGIFSKNKAISKYVIWDKHSYDMGYYWLIVKDCVFKLRELEGDDSFYTEFEKLNEICKKISKKKGCKTDFSSQAIKNFIEIELSDLE